MHRQTCWQCGAKNQINDEAEQSRTVVCEECGAELPTAAAFESEQAQNKRKSSSLINSGAKSKLNQQFSNLRVSYVLIIANLMIFILMAVSGVNVLEPENQSIYNWGADFGPASLGTEPWRLISSMFLHIGIIHLAFNMYALSSIGPLAEDIFGKARFLILYVLAGLGGNFFSICWNPAILSAGASGAIFGLLGGIVGLLIMRKRSFPSDFVQQNLTSIIVVLAFNVILGLSNPFINNAAHFGGFVTGFILALALRPDVDNWRLQRFNPHVKIFNSPKSNANGWRQIFDVKQLIGIILFVTILCLAAFVAKTRIENSNQARIMRLVYSPNKITVQSNKVIHFVDNVTKEEAQKLGNYLLNNNFFNSANGADIELSKNKEGYQILLILKEGSWDNQEIIESYEKLADDLSASVFDGQPVNIGLCDDQLVIKTTVKNK